MKTILDKRYDGESIIDVTRDVQEAIEDTPVPIDEHDFAAGRYRVVITFEAESTQHKGFAQPKGEP